LVAAEDLSDRRSAGDDYVAPGRDHRATVRSGRGGNLWRAAVGWNHEVAGLETAGRSEPVIGVHHAVERAHIPVAVTGEAGRGCRYREDGEGGESQNHGQTATVPIDLHRAMVDVAKQGPQWFRHILPTSEMPDRADAKEPGSPIPAPGRISGPKIRPPSLGWPSHPPRPPVAASGNQTSSSGRRPSPVAISCATRIRGRRSRRAVAGARSWYVAAGT